jgi:hypothetical protein
MSDILCSASFNFFIDTDVILGSYSQFVPLLIIEPNQYTDIELVRFDIKLIGNRNADVGVRTVIGASNSISYISSVYEDCDMNIINGKQEIETGTGSAVTAKKFDYYTAKAKIEGLEISQSDLLINQNELLKTIMNKHSAPANCLFERYWFKKESRHIITGSTGEALFLGVSQWMLITGDEMQDYYISCNVEVFI